MFDVMSFVSRCAVMFVFMSSSVCRYVLMFDVMSLCLTLCRYVCVMYRQRFYVWALNRGSLFLLGFAMLNYICSCA